MILSMKNKAQRSLRALQNAAAAVSALALASGVSRCIPARSFAAEKKQQISHTIGKEMQAAQKALAGAAVGRRRSRILDEAEGKPGLTAFDKFKIHDFKGYAEFKLTKYKEAEADYEAALAAGQYTPEETAQKTKLLFRVAAQNQQYAKAIEYGKQVADSPHRDAG